MDAIVLAAGKASRLAPILGRVQKGTIRTKYGSPFAQALLIAESVEVHRVVIVLPSKNMTEIAEATPQLRTKLPLVFTYQPKPIGMMDALREGINVAHPPYLVMLNDIVYEDLTEVVEQIEGHRNASCFVTVTYSDSASQYGVMDRREDGSISWVEKPVRIGSGFVYKGVFLYDGEVSVDGLDSVPQLFNEYVQRGEFCHHVLRKRVYDIGNPNELREVAI